MPRIIRIGSRKSRLAVLQTQIIKEAIETQNPSIQAEIVTMKTEGDRILDKSLEQIGGKGLFIKELEKALLDGRIDLCVHSLKDMPMEIEEELPIVAYSQREDPRDVLIYKPSRDCIPDGGVIGTSSRRRALQMEKLYPACHFQGIRGNVETRLRKLREENYDGTVLAAAGLKRLGMESVIGRIFSVEEIVPAAGQGILAIQGRKGDGYEYLEGINNRNSQTEALAEREFVAALDGGCTSPVAAHAVRKGNELKLTGLYYREEDGSFQVESVTGEAGKARRTGALLAGELRRRNQHG